MTAPSRWRGSGLVLVVDDEDQVRQVLGMVLTRIGFSVCHARDGIEALAVARQPPAPLVAVVLDLTMPRLDGHGALVELKRLHPFLPVVLTSGYSAGETNADVRASAEGFLPKPFTITSVREEMERVLGGASAQRNENSR